MIPRSTYYKAVDPAGVVQAAGSARDMRRLCKLNKGWRVWVTDTPIGQNVNDKKKGVKHD
jgi:hypothetical protein